MQRIPQDSQISALLEQHIEAGDFPSAVYLITDQGKETLWGAHGLAVVDPYRITTSLETIYDIASLTKPLVTAMLCARRIESGQLRLEDTVAMHLREFDRRDKQAITVQQLLTHTSGLPAWRPLYILAESDPERVVAQIAEEPLVYTPGERVIYSDLGFIALGFVLENLSGKKLAALAEEEIFKPLKLEQTFFNPKLALQTGIAACETGNLYEENTARDAGHASYSKWRTNLIWGEVHDGNAHFLGGSAGHAGLFSTARETSLLARQFLAGHTTLLASSTCAMFRRNFTDGLEEARSPGWQLAVTKDSTAGAALPSDSFGHTGFTGTSCWVDPVNERTFVLLTNRTHRRQLPFANINAVRRQFHELAVAALERT